MELVRISANESEKLWNMQKEAFAELLERYRDYETNPAAEPLSRIDDRLAQPFTYWYFIRVDGEDAGAVRIVDMSDGSRKRISPIFVSPEYQGRGLAQQAILAAEKLHGSDNWALETILEEPGNCYLYEKMGYHRTGRTEKVNESLTLVFYEKN
ncbi:MAG: GNAT family N-acetyltransferase [Ruminococcus sp.]|nr:GNAT family N-acetyltransferase [Ruminococcus sp.]